MADKDWKKRLEAIGNNPMDETSQRIMAGIEASKKRNAELAKDVDKRRAEYEAKQKVAKTPQKAAETRPKKSPSVPTKVRSSKGGAMTAEVDDTKATSKAAEQKKPQSASSGEGKVTPKKTSNSHVKYKNEPVIKTSEKKPEESVSSIMRNYGRNPKGVRDSQKKLAKGILLAPLRFLNKRTEAQEKKKKGSRYGSPYQLRIK